MIGTAVRRIAGANPSCQKRTVPARWFEVTVDVPVQFAEAVANFLVECGAPGIQSDDHGTTVSLIGHFRTNPPLDLVRRFCSDLGVAPCTSECIRVRQIAEENWAENWKLHFQPQLIGERLYVCPSWAPPPPPERIAIIIDPGMAFGTGQHATTRGCLEFLESAACRRPITRALDVGTGSGVLAIALARLGVPEVWAVDTDPHACAIAQENAACNGVADCIRIRTSVDELSGTFDLVVANLFTDALEQLAPRFTHLLRSDGILICSGLLSDDEHRLHMTYASLGFALEQRTAEAAWVTLSWRRQNG